MQALKEAQKVFATFKQENAKAFSWLKYINPYTPQHILLASKKTKHFVPVYWLTFFGVAIFGKSKYSSWKKSKLPKTEQHVEQVAAHTEKKHH